MDLRISAYTLSSGCGVGLDAHRRAIDIRESGLRPNDYPHSEVHTWIGKVPAADVFQWPPSERQWQARSNALAAIALAQDGFDERLETLKTQVGPHRIGAIVGTSTSSIERTEAGYRDLQQDRLPEEYRQPQVHTPHALTAFVAHYCGITGPSMTISTACSSSAKAFASGARWLRQGIVDAVLVGGVDSLCLSVIHGFNALELVTDEPCRPFDRERKGINLGEAAGFALLTRAAGKSDESLVLRGYGESSDAYHMSHPHPQGRGAIGAMRAALACAGLKTQDIGYANLHGTATRANDTIEAQALAQLFSAKLHASSTKGWTGHTLGAAGMVEAILCLEALRSGILPGTLGLVQPDPELAFNIQRDNRAKYVEHALSNSFGFGGNNCTLIFSRTPTC